MKRTPEYLQQRLETCRKLFFQYEGREHARIEREMRANGFPDFNRRCLYARGVNSGWIEKFRWDQELQPLVNSEQRTVNSAAIQISTGSGSDGGSSNPEDAKTQRQMQVAARAAREQDISLEDSEPRGHR